MRRPENYLARGRNTACPRRRRSAALALAGGLQEFPALCLPAEWECMAQNCDGYRFRLPAGQNRFNQIGGQQRQPENAANITVVDALSMRQFGDRRVRTLF